MAKGAILKEEITQKLLAMFDNCFLNNNGKEIRIEGQENGETLQIKVTLTTAQTNVKNPNSSTPAVPTKSSTPQVVPNKPSTNIGFADVQHGEPTEEEKEKLEDLLAKLGIEV